MGMSDEEIIQRFKVENGDAVAKLGKHDEGLLKQWREQKLPDRL